MQDFDKPIEGYPANLICPNCHNPSVVPIKRKEFICIWFVPMIPVYWGKQLKCNICTWRQDIKTQDLTKYNINKVS